MADETTLEITSALDNSTGRMLARLSSLDQRRPPQPQSFTGQFPGYLTWVAPQATEGSFTHYRLRVNHDAGNPDFEFPPGQTAFQIFYGQTFFLSTFNHTNGLESPYAVLVYDAQGDLFTSPGPPTSNEVLVVTVEYQMTSDPFPVPVGITPQPGVEYIIYLAQDTTGGRTPSWPASYHNGPTAVDGTPSTLTTVKFAYRAPQTWGLTEAKWELVAFQTGNPLT